jgi:hypothetical protein
MAWANDYYGNGIMESFLKTVRREEIHLCEYKIFEYVIARLLYFIEGVYSQKGLHFLGAQSVRAIAQAKSLGGQSDIILQVSPEAL